MLQLNIFRHTFLAVLFVIGIYNYTEYLPDGTKMIMHYDEPIITLTEQEWEELEERDEKLHEEESKQWERDRE